MTALPELHTVSRLEVAAQGLCPPTSLGLLQPAPQVPAGETAVAAALGSPCLRYGLCTAPQAAGLWGRTDFINKIYHCNYGSWRELRTFMASWRS